MLRCIRLGAAFRFDLQCRLKTPPRLSARYGTDASTAHPPPSLPPIPQGRRNRTARVLTNLDPERLDKADFFDFSGITGAGVQVGDRGKFKFQYAGTYDTGKFSMRPFPPATRGFLYYHQPSHLPVGAGEIRFRLTPSDRPSSFAAGADLLLDGIPWRVPLLRLSHTQTCAPLRQMLLDGGLITPDALESTRVVNDRLTRFHACNHTLHSLGQPFTLRFRTPLQKLWSIGPSHCINFRLQGLFQDQRGHKTCYPYSGRHVGCFCRRALLNIGPQALLPPVSNCRISPSTPTHLRLSYAYSTYSTLFNT